MKKYAIRFSYDGTKFCGWQKQRGPAAHGGPSIQETIEDAIRKITNEPTVSLVGSGRTDAGVHALGQVAHFILRDREWDPSKLRLGLNSALPGVIRIIHAFEVPIEFHAQRSAEKKQYSYYFQQGPSPLPHLSKYTYWIRKPLDQDTMHEAVSALIGSHDFKPFQSSGSTISHTVRQIFEAEVVELPIPFPGLGIDLRGKPSFRMVRVRLVGSGFLKQMVRGIAGTLLQIGEGRRPASDMGHILQTLDRKLVGTTAPSRGLWLERVWYEDPEI